MPCIIMPTNQRVRIYLCLTKMIGLLLKILQSLAASVVQPVKLNIGNGRALVEAMKTITTVATPVKKIGGLKEQTPDLTD